MAWMVMLWLLSVGALIGVIYYMYKHTPKVNLPPHESYLEALKAILDNDTTTAYLRLKETVLSDTNNLDAYLRLTTLLRQNGNLRKALQIDSDLNLRQNLSLDDKGEVLFSLAEDYLALKQYEAAEEILNKLADFPNRREEAVSRLVKLFSVKKDWRKAFQHQYEYLKLQNNDDKKSLAELKLKCGDELQAEGKLHEARVEFKDALKYNPHLAEAVVAVGDSYEKENRPEDAVKAWKRIIDIDAARSDLVFARIQRVLFDLGQYSEIEDFYNLVLGRDPRNKHALLGLASMAEKRGESSVAEDYYNQVLDIEAEYLPALLGLIRFYQRQERTADATRVINRTAQTFLQY